MHVGFHLGLRCFGSGDLTDALFTLFCATGLRSCATGSLAWSFTWRLTWHVAVAALGHHEVGKCSEKSLDA